MGRLFRKDISLPFGKEYFISALVGSETGIAVTAAIVLGLNAVDEPLPIILTTLLVTIMVQAFNSSIGSLLSIVTEREIEGEEHKRPHLPLMSATLQFGTYIFSSMIPLLPLIFISDFELAFSITPVVALVSLLAIGFLKGRYIKRNTFDHAATVFLSGAAVISVGYLTGVILEQLGA